MKIGEDGNTDIINSIENTVTYEVEKKWYDKDGDETKAPDGAEVAFNIYRIINARIYQRIRLLRNSRWMER